MVAFNTVARLRQLDDLRAHRREIVTLIGQDFVLRLLPGLLDLPLPIGDGTGLFGDLDDHLLQIQRAMLIGRSGSGRRLAMLQLAHRWTLDERAVGRTPVLLPLTRLDDGRSPVDNLLEPWVLPHEPQNTKQRRSPIALLLPGAPAPAPARLLLIHGLEELAPERRDVWRATLAEAPERWPDLHLVVALPQDEQVWTGYTPLSFVAPAPALVRQWIELLAPVEQQAELLEALAPDGALHPLSERLLEVALLAWLARRSGLPATRAGLYKRALEAVLEPRAGEAGTAALITELQLLAAYDERPSFTMEGFLEPREGDSPYFVYPQVRRYLAARQLVEEGRYEPLLMLEQVERDELVLLLATMLADPTPIYELLWGEGQPDAANALVLGRCLRERAPLSPSWVVRVIGALARLVRSASSQRQEAYDVLEAALPRLDAALPALLGQAVEPFLLRLLETLPEKLSAPRMAALAYDDATPAHLGWALADRLLVLPDQNVAPPLQAPAALARWAYVQALRGPQSRQLLASVATTALPALAEGADAERRRRAAKALLDDIALSIGAQVSALGLLDRSDHPAAQAVIERAIHDEAPDVRMRAIATLAEQDDEQSFTALGHTIFDQTAPWDARFSAIQRLGERQAPAAAMLIEGAARTATLPMYARMLAAAALGSHAAGERHLLALLGDQSCQVEVRAVAARQLGAGGHLAALDMMLGLLSDPPTPGALAEALCDGLGAMGAAHGQGARVRDALLQTIERASDDVGLTLSAVRALGLLGDADAVPILSGMLGAEALARLQRGPHQTLLGEPVEVCLASPLLPPALALRLASTCAEGVTPADRPTTLAEFLTSEADLLRAGAAASLAAIGGTSVRTAILNVLIGNGTTHGPGGATDELIATLAEAEGPENAATLGHLLVASDANPLTRWLAIRHLVEHPAGEEVMRRLLIQDRLDPFTRGALAEALGQRGDPAAIPLLMRIADDRTADMHLRSQAVLALGLLNQPAIEPPIMRLLLNPEEDEQLRGLAAEQLPSTLSEQNRRRMRDMLRRERVPTAIAVGLLRAMIRVGDREALPLLLRYAQDETIEVAQAAIAALATIGDASSTPDLVRITQSPNVDRSVRLEAIGALLRVGGTDFRPLLASYLDQGALPLRLQALEHLIAASDSIEDLLAILTNRTWPLLLRLRVVERVGDDQRALPALLDVLSEGEDDLHLRCLAAEAIERTRHAEALPTLIGLAGSADTPDSVRLRCVNAMSAIGSTTSWLALSRLAEHKGPQSLVKYWATQTLRRAIASVERER
jgi:HEAT repeat protein